MHVPTKLGDHEQRNEGEVLVWYEPAGCGVKLQHRVVVAGKDRVEEARRDGQQRHELQCHTTAASQCM